MLLIPFHLCSYIPFTALKFPFIFADASVEIIKMHHILGLLFPWYYLKLAFSSYDVWSNIAPIGMLYFVALPME